MVDGDDVVDVSDVMVGDIVLPEHVLHELPRRMIEDHTTGRAVILVGEDPRSECPWCVQNRPGRIRFQP